MKFNLFIIAIILSPFATHSANEKFHSINDMYGISMRETTSLCKDDYGFIWASSKSGILRLTHGDYRIYQLPYQKVNVLDVKLVFQDSVLVAYSTNGQLFRYNVSTDSFEFLLDIHKLLNPKYIGINKLLIDKQGAFWIATSRGLYKYFSGNLSRITNPVYVRNVWYDENRFFLIKSDSICIIDSRTEEEKCIFENMPVTVPEINSLFYDKSMNRLWIGCRSLGLFYYDIAQSVFSKFDIKNLPKQPVLDIEENTDSTLLLGIDGQGIWELNKTNSEIQGFYIEDDDNPSSLRGNGVYDILYDKDNGRTWVCTNSGGVSFFDRDNTFSLVNQITHQIRNPNSLCNNNVNKIFEDSESNIWFATNNGISRWNISTNKWNTFYHSTQGQAKVFLAINEDNNGHIWAGTYSSGIYILDKYTGKEIAHYFGEPNLSFTFDIFKDSQGNMWIGGNNGNVCCWSENGKQFRSYEPNSIAAIAELPQEKMLFACSYGVELLDKQTGENKIILSGYLGQDVLIKDDNIWFCTHGEGLIKYEMKTENITQFTIESGLPSNYVNSILYDSGYFWIGTERGLSRFNLVDNSIFNYSSLPFSSVSFNRGAHCKLKNGQIILGTNKGALLFDPLIFKEEQIKGEIFFQNIFLSGRSIRNNSSAGLSVPLNCLQNLTLNYNQNTLTLEMIPIGSAVTDFKFSWKMDGLDAEWTRPTNQRILTYNNIPRGHFRLMVRLYDSSLSQIIAERELILQVTPPFWETGWFRLLIFTIVAGIIYFSLRFYINRLKQVHTEEKVRFFTNTAHDIRTSLSLIKGPVEELVKETNLTELGKRYLQLITEQSRRLSAVVTQLMDFQKVDVGKGQLALAMVDIVKLVAHRTLMFESYTKANKIKLSFLHEQLAYLTAIDELKIEKCVDNLISNAIKYSHPDSRVDITLKCNPNNWTLEVTDTGIGITSQAQRKLFKEFYRSENAVNSKIIGSGVGLMLVKHYIVMHGGNISFVSKENVGSTFKVTLPFKEVADVKKPVDLTSVSEVFSSLPGSQFTSISQQADSRQHGMRLLIVEDNPDMQGFITSALCREFEILTADDGLQGWEAVQKQQPDLVISDVMMPNMDGFELCRRMKSTYETSHVPVILLTSLSEKTQQLHGLGLGADDYLTKPFDMEVLSQRIKSIICNRKVIREKALKIISRNNDEPILVNELNDKFIKKAMEVVRANMANENFNKDEFASAMNASSSLLYKKIKSLTDQSPVDFIKSIRLNHALELLQSKKYTVTEVAEMCGFSYVEYFSLAFKKHFGKAPTKI
jgi:signal transduction histidine kinase/DNA-binding response OmpR family regulator/ligand-binding sensor domain-containing protein